MFSFMKNYRDKIFLKGKESVLVTILSVIILIVLFVPLSIIFLLRFLYILIRNKQKKDIPAETQITSNLEKVF